MTKHRCSWAAKSSLIPLIIVGPIAWSAPAVPAAPRAAIDSDRVTLSWTPRGDVDVYQVQRAVGETGRFHTIAVVPRGERGEQRFVDSLSTRAGERFFYALTAVDADGAESERGPAAGIRGPDTTAPAASMITALENRDGALLLRWSEPPDEDVAGYQIFRSTDGGESVLLNEALIEARELNDPDVLHGTVYGYAVIAVDVNGNASRPSATRSRRALSMASIDAVTGVSAATRDGTPSISWKPVAGSRGYIVARSEREESGFVPVSGLVGEASYLDPGATGNSYYYVVIAVLESNQRTPPSAPVVWRRDT